MSRVEAVSAKSLVIGNMSTKKTKRSSRCSLTGKPGFDYQHIDGALKQNGSGSGGKKSSKASKAAKKDWTNVKLPATSLAGMMKNVAGIDESLYAGLQVYKLTTGGVWKPRILTLSRDNTALFCTHKRLKSGAGDVAATVFSTIPFPLWTPSRGFSFTSNKSYRDRYVRCIDIADIDSWQVSVTGTQKLEFSAGKGNLPVMMGGGNGNPEDLYFSIYYHGNMTFDLSIQSEDSRKKLDHALRVLTNAYKNATRLIGSDALLLRYIWYDVDQDASGGIDQAEFVNICHRINFTHKARKAFEDYKTQNGIRTKEITYAQCMQLLQSVRAEKVKKKNADLWKIWFGDAEEVSAEVVWDRLLNKVQKESTTTVQDAQALLKYLQDMDLDGIDGGDYQDDVPMLHRSQFEAFLMHEINDVYDPVAQMPSGEKLDQPISHYWINTSHNTYLTGDQLKSYSSVEAYARALNRGCKCLELDCWDGEAKTATIPVVYHGHTITSKIAFKSICLVVKCFLDQNPNTYPIILSLENHCSHNFQRVMAKDMKDIFGDKLFAPTAKQTEEQLPSPEALRGMVVIKGKRPPEPDDGVPDDATKGTEPEDDEDPYDKALKGNQSAKPTKSKIVPELAQLTLFHGTKFKDFKKSIQQTSSHMHSIGESKIVKIIGKSTDNPTLWREYNQGHMTRTYPAGIRVDSSNYNPVLAWAMGSQLVALNFQTHDTPLLLNDGLFRQNHNSGYVLKPASLMGGGPAESAKIRISVISGHCIPKPKGEKDTEAIDPYVKVELHDVKVASSGTEEYYTTSHQTKTIDDNGYCPVWNDKGAEFDVQNVDVAMLIFNVCDADVGFDDQIAGAAVPVSCLRCGYRSVQLFDMNNIRTGAFRFATLLVKVDYL